MKFNEHYEFKPSDVIEGLNEFYRKVGERRRFEAKYGLSTPAAGPFLVIKRRCGEGLTTSFYEPIAVEEAITWLREECDIFYQPGLKWEDLKYKLPDKAAEKEFGTTDIREMYPACLIRPRCCGKKIWISSNPSFRDDAFHKMVEAERAAKKYTLKQFEKDLGLLNLDLPWELNRDEAEKVMNYCMNDVIATEELYREKQRIDGQEAIEGLRTLYYAVATRHERALRRLDECLGGDRDWPETTYMLEYIRKRVETADENVEYLCKENDDLRNQVTNLKDLINQIHEESDI